MTLRDWRRWYEKIWEIEPEDDATLSDLRWAVAFALIKFHDNVETAAHVISGLNWDRKGDVPRLQVLAAKIEAQVDADEKAMRERLQSDFNADVELD